jgi:hypothetical protein
MSRRPIVSNQKPAAVPAAHQCPSCNRPQTKIKRVLANGKFGSSNFVCSRMDCSLAIDVSKLETWVPDDSARPLDA